MLFRLPTKTRLTPGKFFFVIALLFSVDLFSQPTISSFSPTSGPVGTSVTITGTNFSVTPANNIVFFGAVKANVTAAASTSLTVTVPPGTTYQPITVTVNGLVAYSRLSFVPTFSGGAGGITSTSFSEKIDFTTDLHPNGLAMTDLDGDGKPDLVTPNNYSINGQPASISILRNISSTGTIDFAPKMDITNGVETYAIAAGEIDGDGKPDIVACSIVDQNISVFRNTSSVGLISFAPKVNFGTGSTPFSIGIGDVDGDGKPDIAVANVLSNTISVFRNTGTVGVISFAPKVDFITGLSPECLAIGDVDLDGKADIVVTNNLSNTFSLFRNNSTAGTISFNTRIDVTCFNSPHGILLFDANDDGKLDIAVNATNPNNNQKGGQIFRNTSTTGNFSVVSSSFASASFENTYLMTAGDANGDGKSELVVGATEENYIKVFQNYSSGGTISFGGTGQSFYSFGPFAVGLVDLDGDVRPELIATNFTSDKLSVLKNRMGAPDINSFTPTTAQAGNTVTISGVNFTGTTSVTFGGIPASSFTVVNANTITAVVGAGASGDVVVTTALGLGSKPGFLFAGPPTISSFNPTFAGTGNTVTIHGNNFTGATAVSFGGVAATSFTIVDINTITAVVGTGASGNVSVTTPYGTATLPGFIHANPVITSFTPTSAGTGTSVTITGLNFTGATAVSFGGTAASSFIVNSSTSITAIVGGGSSGNVSVTTSYGTSTLAGFSFTMPPPPGITSVIPSFAPVGNSVTIAGSNFNTVAANNIVYFGSTRATVNSASATQLTVTVPAGSSYQPVSVLNSANGLTGYSPQPFITTFPNGELIDQNSFGLLQAFTPDPEAYPHFLTSSDLDGDGKVDMVTTTSGWIAIYKNTSTSGIISFAPATFITGVSPNGVAATDVDGDGKPDIVLADGGNFSVFRNISIPGNISFAPKASFPAGSGVYFVDVTDLTGDGKPELITVGLGGTIVNILRNTSTPGAMSFSLPVTLTSAGQMFDFITGDIDGDGKRDIATINRSTNNFSVFINASSGETISFGPRTDIATANTCEAIGIGDLNNDGKPDIITASGTVLSTFRNTTSGGSISFDSRTDFGYSTSPPHDIQVTDINGDGRPDVMLAKEWPTNAIQFFKNTGTGTNVEITMSVGLYAASVWGSSIADLDGDGKPDVMAAITDWHELGIFRNKTDGPFIQSFTPTSGATGSSVTITGMNFTGATSVKFGGTAAASFTVNSATTITAVVGTGSTGNVDVATPKGTASKDYFTYIPPLSVSSFTPVSGGTGSSITIYGTSFYDVTGVSFGGVPASSFVVNGPGGITAIVGAGASGSVTVTTASGSASKPSFTYYLPPTITSFSPQMSGNGGQIDITGTNFNGVTDVKFGGVSAFFIINSSTSITATIINYGASGNLTVTNPAGTATMPGFTFVFGPGLGSFIPATAGTGTTIRLTGSHFENVTSVKFGGVPASSFTIVSPTQIDAVVGSGASGQVEVSNIAGAAAISGFTFTTQPLVYSFSPTSAGPGTTVTINGSNLDGATAVNFGGTPAASFTVNSATSITAVVGSGSSGSISVTTPAGTASLAGFTYVSPPTISSFTPVVATTGMQVVITGTGFTGATAVKFGGTPATSFVVINSTSISAVLGPGTSGSVSVITPAGTASLAGFTFADLPVITSFTPTSGTTGTVVTITGTGFTGTTDVGFGGMPAASFTVVNATTINATVSTGASGNVALTTAVGSTSLPGFTYNTVTAVGGDPANNNTKDLQAFPNPGDDQVLIRHPASAKKSTIRFVDILGRDVKTVVPVRNSSQTTTSVKGLKAGIYQIFWSDGKKILTRTFMVK